MQKIQYDNMFKSEEKHWWYAVRRLLVQKIIKRLLPGRKDLSLLDVGCGTGLLLQELQQYGNVTGLDVDVNSMEYCKQRGLQNVYQIVSKDLPAASDAFDVVLCLDVLEHIEDDMYALHEIYRVQKKDGYTVIFCPAFKFLWSNNDVVSMHFRRYTLPELERKAVQVGFKIVQKGYFNFILFIPIYLARLILKMLPAKENVSELNIIHPVVNSVLYFIFKLELLWIPKHRFPFGVSCMLILKK